MLKKAISILHGVLRYIDESTFDYDPLGDIPVSIVNIWFPLENLQVIVDQTNDVVSVKPLPKIDAFEIAIPCNKCEDGYNYEDLDGDILEVIDLTLSGVNISPDEATKFTFIIDNWSDEVVINHGYIGTQFEIEIFGHIVDKENDTESVEVKGKMLLELTESL